MNQMLSSLDQLQELPLPPAVSYWPQTWGWAVLLGLLVLAMAAGAWHAMRQRRRNRYRRQALRWLEVIEQGAATNPEAARRLPELLKRVGISAAPGRAAAIRALRGPAWTDFLQRTGKRAFPDDAAELLAMLAYAPAPVVAALSGPRLQALFDASRQWVEHHRVET